MSACLTMRVSDNSWADSHDGELVASVGPQCDAVALGTATAATRGIRSGEFSIADLDHL